MHVLSMMIEQLLHWPDTATLPLRFAVTAAVSAAAWILSRVVRAAGEGSGGSVRARFWFHQLTRLTLTVVWFAAVLWIWVRDTSRAGTIAAILTAGLTVALQKVITSFAGYFSILRGNTFSVGDRITMGGVRGDVVSLTYLRTTIMEMGQPPSVQSEEPVMWVEGRQYTGRIVTITNDKVFDTPVYNYTREFPFVWEEIRVPVRHEDPWREVEALLLELVKKHSAEIMAAAEATLPVLLDRFALFEKPDVAPHTFVRLTDNWVEVTVRFIARDHGVRELKSTITRDILDRLKQANIPIGSTTFEVVGVPELRITTKPAH
jgi:small-conductance mechanosensitive channel